VTTQQLQAEAARIHPLPLYGNTFDPEYFKIREKRAKHKQRLWIIANKETKQKATTK